ncbi:fumarylacetoacetate hydrolase family protein [Amycolatopsis acidiphila]|nr:fumarylacetoacetate hydrolase family protein [Amycolatopsis acidiphila]UIJ59758.1 fumarylacetoacetate hydrolase family protein [Amycolatopsis acidiphila]GHG98473.1 4-oxalocrotonate decarboxylase [Amycolatopsis acidiphila]
MGPARLQRWAATIDAAHRQGWLLQPITDTEPVTLTDAYTIQELLTARRTARGARPIGWKLGYTSAAMREQMGVDAPNYGPLTDQMVLADGGALSVELIQPRAEPEIAIRLHTDVRPGTTVEHVRAAIGDAYLALEIVDSVWQDYRFRLEDNTADGSSAAHVVLGPALHPGTDLGALRVVLRRNGAVAGTGHGRAVMGHPVHALTWLARELSRRGKGLRAGDVVLTGGLTAAVPVRPGDVISAAVSGYPPVTVHRRATAAPPDVPERSPSVSTREG